MGAEEKINTAKKKINVIPIITSLIAVTFLCLSVMFYVGKEQERTGRLTAEKKLEQTLVAKKVVEQNLRESLQKNEDLTGQVKKLEDQVSTVKEALTKAETENLSLTQKFQEGQKTIVQLRENLQAEQGDKKTLAQDLEEIRTQYAQLQEKLTNLQKPNSSEAVSKSPGEQQKETAQEEVQLGKITVSSGAGSNSASEPATSESTQKNGRILVVNDEFNFVVVSFGKNDGLKGGEVLSVYREGQFLGKIKVEKLYDAISAATILEGKTGYYKEGDVVHL